jgi:hypothetical protein
MLPETPEVVMPPLTPKRTWECTDGNNNINKENEIAIFFMLFFC